MDIEKEKQAVLDTDRAFSELSVEKGMREAFDACMADDATMYSEGSHPIVGRQAIGARLRGPEAGTLKWEPFQVEVAASGDLAYTLGNWELTSIDSDGNQQTGYGHYVSIWKKQADGYWKWVFDTGVNSPGPKETANA